MHAKSNTLQLYDDHAERRYLNAEELARFLAAAEAAPPQIRRFALTLAYTGVRISEGLALRGCDLQPSARILSVATLKRRRPVVREVPLPPPLAEALAEIDGGPDTYIWQDGGKPVPRGSAYRWIKAVMTRAGLDGIKACPRGLRHSFGVRATLAGVPLHMLQRWMGHASMETTAIYATVLGPEQLFIADRMWSEPEASIWTPTPSLPPSVPSHFSADFTYATTLTSGELLADFDGL